MTGRTRAAAMAAAVLLTAGLAGSTASAQQAPATPPATRAFDRLFTTGETSGPSKLTLAVYQGINSIDAPLGASLTGLDTGNFLAITPTASFSGGTRHPFGLTGGGSVRRYTDAGTFQLVDGHFGFGTQFSGRRVRLLLNETVNYAPYQQLLPRFDVTRSLGGSVESLPETAGTQRSVTTATTAVALDRQLSQRVGLSANYSLQFRHLGEVIDPTDQVGDLQTHIVSAGIRRQLNRYTVLFAGYATRFSTESTDGTVQPNSTSQLRTHDLNIGVDRAQQLSLSRRTTLMFSTGSTIAQVHDGYRFFITGTGLLRYDLSRTWSATGGMSRGVTHVESLKEPVFADSLVFTLGGAIGSRMDLTARGGYSNGTIGVAAAPGDSGYRAYTGSVRGRALLTRRLALFGEWVAYRQRFDEQAELPSLFDRHLKRQEVRFGIMMNVPLQSERGVR